MKFTAASLLLGLVSLAAATKHPHLRQGNGLASAEAAAEAAAAAVAASNCYGISSEEQCKTTVDTDSNTSCVWCQCAAVPPVCVSEEESQSLPPGVFDCASYSEANPDKDENENEDENEDDEKVYDFGLESGAVLQLRETISEASDLCDASSKSISGYMSTKGSKYDEYGDKHLFFWMFEKRGSDETDENYGEEEDDNDNNGNDGNKDDIDTDIPFVVWLTGGPGCSSTLALLTENGPCSVNADGKGTTVNPHSWTEAAHVLWLDQPAGVGFSYGDENDSGEGMVGEDAYYFFQTFFQAHPEYASNPLYIIGESYGGHYVPAISHRIWQGNQKLCENCIPLNYSGLAIGNGLTAPEEQYPWYPEMVWNNSHGIKVVDEGLYNAMKEAVPLCTKLIHECDQGDGAVNSFACQAAFVTCNLGLTSPYQATGLNPYDIRKKCEVPPLCYDFSNVKDWLNLVSTKQALGVDTTHSHRWEACNFGINAKFHTDWMKDFSGYVRDLLEAGFPALIYAGDVDFICNYLGNQAWTKDLDWSHKADFETAGTHDWGNGAGLARTSHGFTFLQVYDGGHMVPADQPEVSLRMLQTFLSGGEF
mmetsp:Transcript_27809/g.65351  ORF Transcript_27809/g.65351 Transcript_27809/m.65351 type:complete len:592 (-) Transcript_27809:60-1835(-)